MSKRSVPLLATVAALLPWLTWALPVYSFDSEQFADEGVLLRSVLEGAESGMFLLGMTGMFAVLAVAAWIRPSRLWAVLALLVVTVTGLLLIPLGQGSIIWDGVDAQGRPTAGYEELAPDWGLLAMLLSLLLLVIAAVLVLRGRQRG